MKLGPEIVRGVLMPRGEINKKWVERIYQAFLQVFINPYLEPECATKISGDRWNGINEEIDQNRITGLPDFKH